MNTIQLRMRVNTKQAKILNNNVTATMNHTRNQKIKTMQISNDSPHKAHATKKTPSPCNHRLTQKTEYNTIANGSIYKTTQQMY